MQTNQPQLTSNVLLLLGGWQVTGKGKPGSPLVPLLRSRVLGQVGGRAEGNEWFLGTRRTGRVGKPMGTLTSCLTWLLLPEGNAPLATQRPSCYATPLAAGIKLAPTWAQAWFVRHESPWHDTQYTCLSVASLGECVSIYLYIYLYIERDSYI